MVCNGGCCSVRKSVPHTGITKHIQKSVFDLIDLPGVGHIGLSVPLIATSVQGGV